MEEMTTQTFNISAEDKKRLKEYADKERLAVSSFCRIKLMQIVDNGVSQ